MKSMIGKIWKKRSLFLLLLFVLSCDSNSKKLKETIAPAVKLNTNTVPYIKFDIDTKKNLILYYHLRSIYEKLVLDSIDVTNPLVEDIFFDTNDTTERYLISICGVLQPKFKKAPCCYILLQKSIRHSILIQEFYLGTKIDKVHKQIANTYFKSNTPVLSVGDAPIGEIRGKIFYPYHFFYQPRRTFKLNESKAIQFQKQVLDSLFWQTLPQKKMPVLGYKPQIWSISGIKNGYYHQITDYNQHPNIAVIHNYLLDLTKNSELKENLLLLKLLQERNKELSSPKRKF